MRKANMCSGSLAVMALLIAMPANAQTPIGGAKDIRNDVRGQTGARTMKIALGDQVFQNQMLRTGADSLARVVFIDETNMSVGPQSEVKLDRFVYDPDGNAKAAVFNATRGAFRFFSGNSDHKVYGVQTPQAVIGVRGTVYDVRVQQGLTTVVLVEGAVNVCLRNTARCADMSQPGQIVNVRDDDIEGPLSPDPTGWNFGAFCGADPAQSPYCTRGTKLGLDLTPRPPAAKAAPVRKAAAPAAKPPRKKTAAKAPPRRTRTPTEYVETYYVREPVYYPAPAISFGIGIGPRLPEGGYRPPRPRGDGRVPVPGGGYKPPRPQGDGRVPVQTGGGRIMRNR
jgi:hypothetical protein